MMILTAYLHVLCEFEMIDKLREYYKYARK